MQIPNIHSFIVSCFLSSSVYSAPPQNLTPTVASSAEMVPAVPADESVLINASFSRGGVAPDGWTLSKESKTAKLLLDSSIRLSAPSSLRVDANGDFTVSQNWKSAPSSFTLSGSTKTSGDIKTLKYDLQVFDASWKQLVWISSEDNDTNKLQLSKEWREFRREISLPAGAINVVFYFGGSGIGSAWLDDMNVEVAVPADHNPNANRKIGDSAPVRVLDMQPYRWGSLSTAGVEFATGFVWNVKNPEHFYLRADGGGIWKLDRKNNRWIALMDNIPWNWSNLTSVESIGVDANNPNVLYVAGGSSRWNKPHDILKTIDGGKTWTRTMLKNERGEDVMSEANGPDKQGGERLAVDPNNSNILFFGSRNDGLFTSVDAAKTWGRVNSFPKGALGFGVPFVVLDWQKGKNGEATKVMYAGVRAGKESEAANATVAKGGVYQSRDGGKSWTILTGGPDEKTNPMRARLATDGTLYVTTVSPGQVWKWKNNVWTDITPEKGFDFSGVNIDPRNENRVLVSPTNGDGNLPWFYSDNAGKTWTKYQTTRDNKSGNAVRLNPPLYETGGDDKWPSYTADVAFDPFDASAVWEADFGGPNRTFDMGKPKLNWTLIGEGREQMTTADGISPTEGAPFVSGIWDLGGFRYEEGQFAQIPKTRLVVLQSNGAPHSGYESYMNSFQDVFDMDASPLLPDTIVVAGGWLWNNTGDIAISRDNGKTFLRPPSKPFPDAKFGRVAVSAKDADNLIWAPLGTSDSPVYFTRDGGKTWKAAPTAPRGMINTNGAFTFFKPLTADRVQPNTFYIYHRRDGKFFRSQDGGATWKHLSSLPTQPGNHWDNHKLEAAPYVAGEVWLALHDQGLLRTRDGGASWTKMSGVSWAVHVSFGKPAPEKTNPTIWLIGQIGGATTKEPEIADVDLYRSDDDGASWTRVNGADRGLGGVGNLTGDMQKYGRVYIGTGGRGTFYGEAEIDQHKDQRINENN